MKILRICFCFSVCKIVVFSRYRSSKSFRGFVREIPESEKIKETFDFIDTTEIDKLRYSFLNKTLDVSYESKPLKVIKLSGEKFPDLISTEVFFGGGTHSIHTDVSFNSLEKR